MRGKCKKPGWYSNQSTMLLRRSRVAGSPSRGYNSRVVGHLHRNQMAARTLYRMTVSGRQHAIISAGAIETMQTIKDGLKELRGRVANALERL
jgi:hypothetical protein